MAQQRLGIIMNGVTGRMGMNQHLIRSIVAIRAQGGVALQERRPGDARPDPGRPQRRQARGSSPRRTASRAGPPTSTPRSRIQDDTLFFDAATTQLRAKLLQQGDRGRQAHLLREADRRRRSRTRSTSRAPRTKAGIKHGVVQDKLFLPGLLKLKMLIDVGLLRPHPRRCAASSATGCSRATGSRRSGRRGTTARRTAAASSSTCSATGATCSTICSAR